jgi:hypothetical protein
MLYEMQMIVGQQHPYRAAAAMVNGGKVVLLVRNISVLPDSGSLKRIR